MDVRELFNYAVDGAREIVSKKAPFREDLSLKYDVSDGPNFRLLPTDNCRLRGDALAESLAASVVVDVNPVPSLQTKVTEHGTLTDTVEALVDEFTGAVSQAAFMRAQAERSLGSLRNQPQAHRWAANLAGEEPNTDRKIGDLSEELRQFNEGFYLEKKCDYKLIGIGFLALEFSASETNLGPMAHRHKNNNGYFPQMINAALAEKGEDSVRLFGRLMAGAAPDELEAVLGWLADRDIKPAVIEQLGRDYVYETNERRKAGYNDVGKWLHSPHQVAIGKCWGQER